MAPISGCDCCSKAMGSTYMRKAHHKSRWAFPIRDLSIYKMPGKCMNTASCGPPASLRSTVSVSAHSESHVVWLPSILPPSPSIMLTGYFRKTCANFQWPLFIDMG